MDPKHEETPQVGGHSQESEFEPVISTAIDALRNYFPEREWKDKSEDIGMHGKQLWKALNPPKNEIFKCRDVTEFANQFAQFNYIARCFVSRAVMFNEAFSKVVPLQQLRDQSAIEVLILGSGPAPETYGLKKVLQSSPKTLKFYCADRYDWTPAINSQSNCEYLQFDFTAKDEEERKKLWAKLSRVSVVICSFVLVEVLRGRDQASSDVVYDKIKYIFDNVQPKTVFVFVDIMFRQLYNPIKKRIDQIWGQDAKTSAVRTKTLSVHSKFRERLKGKLFLTKARIPKRKEETCFITFWQKNSQPSDKTK